MWSVDGMSWDIPCTIKRTAELTESEISGMMLNKTYFNDVIGTYMKYTVAIAVPKGREEDYIALYEVLTSPEPYHQFTLPYNDTYINMTARVQVVNDEYVRLFQDRRMWRRTTFEIIGSAPLKTMNGQTLEYHGTTPYPDAVEPIEGDIYEYTSNGWILRYYTDAENTEY